MSKLHKAINESISMAFEKVRTPSVHASWPIGIRAFRSASIKDQGWVIVHFLFWRRDQEVSEADVNENLLRRWLRRCEGFQELACGSEIQRVCLSTWSAPLAVFLHHAYEISWASKAFLRPYATKWPWAHKNTVSQCTKITEALVSGYAGPSEDSLSACLQLL